MKLPRSLQDLASHVGISGALAIAERWGGIRLHVPHVERINSGHPLVQAIGMKNAESLARYAGGEWMEIPLCHLLSVRRRDAEMVAARQGGASTREIAKQFRLTERGVRLAMERYRREQSPQ